MADYWSGLIGGFQDRREKEYLRNYELELQNRQASDRVFQYLLQSRDPRMQELALSGLMNPMAKKKGLAGFLGGMESNPVLGQIVGAMNELIPDTSGAPTPPAQPGSAAMSTNQPVRAGSQPIPLPPEMPLDPGAADVTSALEPAGPPGMGGMPQGASIPFPPGPPPESKWKRRGTGVPTAEEVAEMQARIPLQTRIQTGQQAAAQLGLAPDDLQQLNEDIIRAATGTPVTARQFQPSTTFAARLPDGRTLPLGFDVTKGRYVLPDGVTPFDQATMTLVRMGGAGGSVPRTAREPDPQFKTGWARVFYDTQTGEELYRVQDVPFIPPAEAIAPGVDQAGNPISVTVPRVGGGGGGRVVASGQNPQPPIGQSEAQSALSIFRQRLQAAQQTRFGQPVVLDRIARDRLAKEVAMAAGLPYQNEFELDRAARIGTARQVEPRPEAPAAPDQVNPSVSIADRIRERAIRNRQGGGGGGRTAPTAPPARPPARSTGPGPRQ